jgi:hypothetical protein
MQEPKSARIKKGLLEDEIEAVEAQLNAVGLEITKIPSLPPQVLNSLKSLGESIKKLRQARDAAKPTGIYMG